MKKLILLFVPALLVSFIASGSIVGKGLFDVADFAKNESLRSAEFSLMQDNNDNDNDIDADEDGPSFRAYHHEEFRFSVSTSFLRGIGGYGYTLGSLAYGYERRGALMPIQLSLEKGVTETFSMGGLVGYYSNGYRFREDNFMWYDNRRRTGRMWRYTVVGASGTFHPRPYMDEMAEDGFLPSIPEQIDFYGTAALGLVYTSRTDEFRDASNSTSSNIGLSLGISIGGRYYFNDNFAFMVETGRGLFGLGSFGLTYRY